jgi:hypothetical protein
MIHPAIGIARVGNDGGQFFLGPEIPGKGPVGADAGVGSSITAGANSGFKTGTQSVKRQGQRFRVFSHFPDKPAQEVTLDSQNVKSIQWSVHLANRKARFFQFLFGRVGESPATVYAPGPGQKRRNDGVLPSQTVIDPGKPQTISGRNQTGKKIDQAFAGTFPKHKDTGATVIDLLGELVTDSAGRLVVLGGRGLSRPFLKVGGANPPVDDFVNNDGWLDDVSDGFVQATVTMNDGKKITPEPSWVLVGPPDFAPFIGQVVSLYDLLWDVAARNASITIPDLQMFKQEPLKRLKTFRDNHAAYKPEFFSDIEPTLRNAANVRFVFNPAGAIPSPAVPPPGIPLTIQHSQPIASLAAKIDTGILDFLRPPNGNKVFGFAPASMPFLFGDDFHILASDHQALALTASQFENFQHFKAGTFDTGAPLGSAITPEGIDRAALESCAGGAFCPGIECGWMMRNPNLFKEPFRLKPVGTILNPAIPLKIEPGLFSQQLAEPWQADFLDCADDNAPGPTPNIQYAWWPSQRPIDVKKTPAGALLRWDRGLIGHIGLIQRWPSRGFMVDDGAGGFVEKGGPP